jgi:hypothetical protein
MILSGVLFLLRTGPVKNATRRIGRAVVNSTMRLARPISQKLKRGAKRMVHSFTQDKSSTDKKA